MNKMESQKLICPNPKCKKIIMEAKTFKQLKEELAGQNYIQCPYCMGNWRSPFLNEASRTKKTE